MADAPSDLRARVRLPEVILRGEVFPIRTLVSHRMESGLRRGADGALVPRRIISRIHCSFDGQTVFDCTPGPGIAANPFLEFQARLPGSGTLVLVWTDADGTETRVERAVTVV